MTTVQATRGYAICTEPRSGSNFLCQVLTSTGVLGRPLEYFNTAGRRAFDDPAYPDDPEAQLDRVLTQGVTPNGVYGLKLFSGQSDTLAPRDWAGRLPGLRFIHLERRDVLGQAISWALAQQTQRYRAYAPGEGRAPVYDRRAIQERLNDIVAGQARWRLYFARNGIEALALT
jgi:LPS sulfotransferase NodH